MALLDRGGLVYVCGDARRMAPDVGRALLEVYARRRGVSLALGECWNR